MQTPRPGPQPHHCLGLQRAELQYSPELRTCEPFWGGPLALSSLPASSASHLVLPLNSLCLSVKSLQLYIHWTVGDSFLSSSLDGEVKQPHLVGPDLWVTAEVAMQTAREREVPLSSQTVKKPLAWPGPMSPPGVALVTVALPLPPLFLVTARSSSGHN